MPSSSSTPMEVVGGDPIKPWGRECFLKNQWFFFGFSGGFIWKTFLLALMVCGRRNECFFLRFYGLRAFVYGVFLECLEF